MQQIKKIIMYVIFLLCIIIPQSGYADNIHKTIDNVIYNGQFDFWQWQAQDKQHIESLINITNDKTKLLEQILTEQQQILNAIQLQKLYFTKINNIKLYSAYVTGNLNVLYNAYVNRNELIKSIRSNAVDKYQYNTSDLYIELDKTYRIKAMMPKTEWYLNYIAVIQGLKSLDYHPSLNIYISPYTLLNSINQQVFGFTSQCLEVPSLPKSIVIAYNKNDDSDITLDLQEIISNIKNKTVNNYLTRKHILFHELGHVLYDEQIRNDMYNNTNVLQKVENFLAFRTEKLMQSEKFAEEFAMSAIYKLVNKPWQKIFITSKTSDDLIQCKLEINDSMLDIPFGRKFEVFSNVPLTHLYLSNIDKQEGIIRIIKNNTQFDYPLSKSFDIPLDNTINIQVIFKIGNIWVRIWNININKIEAVN